MDLFSVPGSDRFSVLRALKTVALANGTFEEGERTMLEAAARAYGVEADPDALAPITPEALASAVTTEQDRLRTLQACMLMCLADAGASPEEARVLDGYRTALGVDEPRMAVLHSLAQGHKRIARFHALRTGKGARSQLKGARFTDMLRLIGVLPEDRLLVEKYRALVSFPAGTLGKGYSDYMEKNQFPWPGQKGGIPEAAIHHDFTHVLTGYDTDPSGEIEIGSFTAGMKRVDPFFFLFFVMLEFHVGLQIRPGQPAFPGNYDPDLALVAHQRGSRCKLDLTDGWDIWAVMDRPVAELRAQYGID